MTKRIKGSEKALIQVIGQTLQVVADMAGISWDIRKKILGRMQREVLSAGIAVSSSEEMAFWAEEVFSELINDEEIPLSLRVTLTEHFASEILAHLIGSWDGDAA